MQCEGIFQKRKEKHKKRMECFQENKYCAFSFPKEKQPV
jgi:hypothetical protein